MSDTAQLYDRDWYAWTQDQAARLRAWPEHLWPAGLDVEHLAGEAEDLGGSQRRAIESYLRLVALHLLKLEFHPSVDARSHSMGEVATFRDTLALDFRDSPSLRARCSDLYPGAWRRARRAFRRQLAEEAPERVAAFDTMCPAEAVPRYDLVSQLLAEDWFPDRETG
jgi:hypothetical protein